MGKVKKRCSERGAEFQRVVNGDVSSCIIEDTIIVNAGHGSLATPQEQYLIRRKMSAPLPLLDKTDVAGA
jgi:hypothetical protein